MQISGEIHGRLVAAFAPHILAVEDDSEKHRGHGGYREGGQSHFRVLIRAACFGQMSRVEQHRAVHNAIGPEILARIHALALDVGA